MTTIGYDDIMHLGFLKKEPFHGSKEGMRFRIWKEGDHLMASVWPEPFSFKDTPEEDKKYFKTGFSEDGLNEILKWLNQRKLEI